MASWLPVLVRWLQLPYWPDQGRSDWSHTDGELCWSAGVRPTQHSATEWSGNSPVDTFTTVYILGFDYAAVFNVCHCMSPVRSLFWHTNDNIVCRQRTGVANCRSADTQARRRLRSASSTSLNVRRTRLSTVGDRAFPVAAARLWNSLPSHVTAPPPLYLLLSS